jgi:hemerythrin-like domain-containing protein
VAGLVETLREEHRNIGRLLRVLERQVDIFAGGGRPDYDVVAGVADYFLDFPDHCHHPKEDAVTARLAAKHPNHVATLGFIVEEHQALHRHAARFRELVAALLGETDVPRAEVVGAARRFIDAQWTHMRREERELLPLAERLLDAADWGAIEDKLDRRRDPLFSGEAEARFRKLSEQLVAWAAEDETSS